MRDAHGRKGLAMFVYVMQGLGFLFGFTWIVAVVVNHAKRSEVAGTWLESHFRWQIRTFWFGLLWALAGLLLLPFGLGTLVWLADYLWIVYRVVRGWLFLNDNKPLPAT